jgi:hypothetical protein
MRRALRASPCASSAVSPCAGWRRRPRESGPPPAATPPRRPPPRRRSRPCAAVPPGVPRADAAGRWRRHRRERREGPVATSRRPPRGAFRCGACRPRSATALELSRPTPKDLAEHVLTAATRYAKGVLQDDVAVVDARLARSSQNT